MPFSSFFRRRRARRREDTRGNRVAADAGLGERPAARAIGEAEVHRFNDRLFATGEWGYGAGVAVPAGAGAGTLGELVQRALRDSRAQPPRSFRADRGPWEAFCRDVAGSSMTGYRPEIRVRVWDSGDDVLSVRCETSHDDAVALPADAEAERIGEAVLRKLAAAEPEWPTARYAALVSEASGGLVVHSHRGSSAIGPVRRIDSDAGDAVLAAAIRAALDSSSEEPAESDPEPFDRALAEVGLEHADLAGGAMVSIRETTKGAIRIKPWQPVRGGWDPAATAETAIPDGDPIAVARAARAGMLGIPTRHRKPGVRTGASFGSKTAWLAVRDGASERVADAIGLTAREPLSWQAGVDASAEDGIFVSPPTSGWILAAGVGWFGNEPDVAALSARLATEVQFFATHRVAEAHTWERAVDGRRVRRLSYVGESGELEQEGEATDTERELGLADLDEDAAAGLISEDTAFSVAEGWSLNPQRLETTPTAGSIGIHGRLPAT